VRDPRGQIFCETGRQIEKFPTVCLIGHTPTLYSIS
jgi:hypothetical protein